jgi:L-iditol 2-dehydrogenase
MLTMRAAQLTGIRKFQIAEASLPDPGPGKVQVRIEAVGVCGSDLHSWAEGAVGDTPCQYPMVLGHEPAGTVLKTGTGVTGWTAGDRAAFEPALYCYHCEFCMAGRHNVCAHLRFLSTPGEPGFFRDVANLPAGNLLALPPGVGTREGSLVEPLAVALHSLTLAPVRAGETAVVFGAGPIGLLTIAALRLLGAGRLWSVEPIPARRDFARAMGADAAIDPKAVDPVREILKDTGGRGVDLAFDCATKDATIRQSIEAACHGGRVIVTGIPSEIETPLPFSPLRRKEITLYNVRRSNHESQAALDMLARHARLFAPLLTHTRPLEGIASGFELAASYGEGVGKLLIAP